MADYQRLKGHLAYRVQDAATVYVVSETQSFHLSGRAYPHLLPRLRDGVSLRALLADPPAGLAPVELAYALECLTQRHLLTSFAPAPGRPDALFWEHLEQDPALVPSRLADSVVALVDLATHANCGALVAVLAGQGIALQAAQEGGAALQIVLVDDYLDPRLEQINQANHARRQPWLLAKPGGALMWVGPLMDGAGGACWRCLQHRIQYRRKLPAYLRLHQGAGAGDPGHGLHFSSASAIAMACIGAEAVKFLALDDVRARHAHLPSMAQIITIDALSYQQERHAVVRRPQCPCCGDPVLVAAQQARPPVFDGGATLPGRRAGLRLRSAQQVCDALQRHVSPIIGIIGTTHIVTQSGDDEGVTTSVAAEHNFSLIDSDSSYLQERIRSCSGGKGTSLIQARASALCESIERFSGMYQGDEKRILSSMADLPNAIHPNDCLLFSDTQYRERARTNPGASRIGWVPQPFDPARCVDWTPLWSLTDQQCHYLPTSYCFYGYARQHDCDFAKADSNGCAAGSSLSEAVVQGFLELVERDAAALWWYNRRLRPGVDWRSFDEPYVQAVAQYYARSARSFWVLDITSDLGIPCFAALCARPGAPAEEITFAFGAHFDARIALLRAVTELNQIMPNLRHDKAQVLQSLGNEALRWWQEARLADHAYLSAHAQPGQAASYPAMDQLTLAGALQACIDCARKHGLNLLVLDQSRPDADLAVVRVVVPSLRHFWPRHAPGRLYAGAGAAASESGLNPYPIFI